MRCQLFLITYGKIVKIKKTSSPLVRLPIFHIIGNESFQNALVLNHLVPKWKQRLLIIPIFPYHNELDMGLSFLKSNQIKSNYCGILFITFCCLMLEFLIRLKTMGSLFPIFLKRKKIPLYFLAKSFSHL